MKTNEITGAELYRGRHGAAPGVRSPRKRRAGARRGAAPLAVLLALVMALAFPARAFASVYNNPIVTWTSLQSCDVCGPNNEFDAALAIIERTNTKIQISEPMYVELSNEGSGGRFYQLAKSLKCAADEMPGSGDFVLSASVSAGVSLYGADYVWWQHGITASDDLITGALQDYETILNGGHLGGGGNGPVVETEDYIVVPCRVLMTGTSNSNRFNMVDTSGQIYCNIPNYATSYRTLPNVINFRVRKSLFNANTLSQHVITDACVRFTSISGVSGTVNNGTAQITLISNSSSRVTVSLNNYSFTKDGQSYSGQYYGSAVQPANSYSLTYTVTGQYFSFDGTTITDISTNTSSSRWVRNSSEVTVFSGDNKIAGCTSGESGGGGGDNNWPGPSEPEPGPPEPVPQPEPDPGPGPIDWPDPYNPTTPSPGPEPTPTTPVTNPTNTSPADYTPWLMAILSELRGIHTDMNAWLDAIFEGIVDYGAAICSHIDTASENIRSTLRFMTQWMDEQLDASFYALRHLLWECANYIADSLDYTFVGPDVNVPGYDDSSVLYWLKRIYYKLGSGNVNTRPVDPVADHDNWWDWIVQLIKNLILDLGMMGADFLSDMGDVLAEVVQKFPFSIPWDIAAYLTAFSTQPVTPVIVITIPAMSGFLPQIQWTIDLHPYDDAMATVRACETIVFAFWLMWKCPILLDMMDTAKWGI